MNIAKLVRMVQANYGEDDPLLAETLDLILHEIYELETRMDYLQSQISGSKKDSDPAPSCDDWTKQGGEE